MPADYSRIHRLLEILTLIQSDTGWDNARLAAHFGVSERTIYRDFQALENTGIPYDYDEATKGYRVRRNFFMPPVQLTLEESLALLTLVDQVAGAADGGEQLPLLRPAARAMVKVRGALPAKLQDELGRIEDRVVIRTAAAGPFDGIADVYDTVRRAILDRRALRCRYDAVHSRREDAADEEFYFEPYALFFGQRSWYAVGRHDGRDALRSLKLHRFTQRIPTDRPYDIPEDFTIRGYLGLAWRMMPGDEEHHVEIRFDAEFAETVADTAWHPTQSFEPHEDGAATFRCTVSGLREIEWWVLSMGPHAKVVSPPELAERVRELAARTAALYEEG